VKPSIGRIVHYHYTDSGSSDLKTRPAVMVDVTPLGEAEGLRDGTEENRYEVFLLVHNTLCDERHPVVLFSRDCQDGYWTWPPRV
jgi:hypothetical protein